MNFDPEILNQAAFLEKAALTKGVEPGGRAHRREVRHPQITTQVGTRSEKRGGEFGCRPGICPELPR